MATEHDREQPAGLSQTEAESRLSMEGANELPGGKRRSPLAILREVLEEPMLVLLLAAGAIYLLLGDMHDALVLLAFAGLSVAITLVQETRTERAIAALRDLSAPQALVIRDGLRRLIPACELVRGDLYVLGEGDRIAADGWVVEAQGLQADEALLTGESVPVAKAVLTASAPATRPSPGGDGLPYVFAGTLAVRGNALIRIAATGGASAIGGIGRSLALLDPQAPRLRVQTGRMVRWFAVFGLGVSLLAVLLYGLLRGGWLEALLAGIALGMSMLPEELPVVLTLFMTMGALRMSRARVLTRRGAAIETLGAATVLCADKTGTLTQNRMEVAELRLPGGESFTPAGKTPLVIPQGFVELAGLGILACLEDPFDPMEVAFHDLAARHAGPSLSQRQDEGWTLQRQYGLDPGLLAMSHVWGETEDGEHIVAAKGAPEAIAGLCGLQPEQRRELEAAAGIMASRGLRVLGVAEARWRGEAFPETQRHFAFAYRGLVGLADPVRTSVPEAVRLLQDAGIRIVMVTGDFPATASAIAAQAGIKPGKVLTGADLDHLDEDALAERARDVAVFARVMPEQKLRIVQALQAAGEIACMTGDGVNDAPSLKAADIGIAMGRRGADVAREAAAIVLLDDDFAAIPAAVRLGRRIYDNLRKAMGFIFAVHIPIGGLALLPLIAGWPLILVPMHIALLEMIIDPTCSLAFEAEREEAGIMRRPPRQPDASLFPRGLLVWSLLQGTIALGLLVALVVWTRHAGIGEAEMRTIAFAGLVASVLVLVSVNRAFGTPGLAGPLRLNLPLAIILAIAAVVFGLLFGSPAIAGLFRLGLLDRQGLLAVAGLALALFLLLSLLKRRFRARLTE